MQQVIEPEEVVKYVASNVLMTWIDICNTDIDLVALKYQRIPRAKEALAAID
tara:strand:- start:3204 stop:3359 length:156 start_codon:yes stop_codon:yes gene_type:complete